MNTKMLRHGLRALGIVPILILTGCSGAQNPLWLLYPNGPIASASIYYLVVDVLMLMIVIIPATTLVIWTFYRYRREAGSTYDPTFNHSLPIELTVWGIPLLIVCALAYFTYKGVHAVDPYDPGALKNAQVTNPKPLKIEVITTDWQWLFVYPDQHVAVSNKLVIPTGRKIAMRLTSASVTNDFYILKIVGQIYVMPGMRTKQHFLVDRTGTYRGFSTEFSGPGFAWMNYKMHAVSPAAFKHWVNQTRSGGQALSYARFKKFARPTVNVGQQSLAFNHVDPNLFRQIIANVKSGKLTHEKPLRMTEDMHSALFKRHAN